MPAKDTEIKVIQGGLMDGAGSIPMKKAIVVINFCGSCFWNLGRTLWMYAYDEEREGRSTSRTINRFPVLLEESGCFRF